MASVEGRVSVEFFEETPEVQARKYAFKCHRQTTAEGDIVYPVNALAFHPLYVGSVKLVFLLCFFNVGLFLDSSSYGTFASGGSDGMVSVWDHFSKKRLRQYARFPTGVSALAFSADGKRMAVGISYSWDVPDQQRREELKKKGDEMETIAIVVKEVGEELKVRLPSLSSMRRFLIFQSLA